MKANIEKRLKEHVGISKEEVTMNKRMVESMLMN